MYLHLPSPRCPHSPHPWPRPFSASPPLSLPLWGKGVVRTQRQRGPWEARSVSGQRQVGRHLPSCLWRRKNPSLGPGGIYFRQGNWRAQRGATVCCPQEEPGASQPGSHPRLGSLSLGNHRARLFSGAKCQTCWRGWQVSVCPWGGKCGVQSSAASLLTRLEKLIFQEMASVLSKGKGS